MKSNSSSIDIVMEDVLSFSSLVFYGTKSERFREVKFVLDFFESNPKMNILDVGFGGGYYARDIVNLGHTYVGLDQNPDRISGKSFKNSAYMKSVWTIQVLPFITTVCSDIIDYHPDEKFDAVISVSVIEHIMPLAYGSNAEYSNDADIKAVDKMKSIVKDGGFLVLTFPCGKGVWHVSKNNPNKEILLANGFTETHRDFIYYDEYRISRIVDNWEVVEEKYWCGEKYAPCSKKIALEYDSGKGQPRSICCIILKKI